MAAAWRVENRRSLRSAPRSLLKPSTGHNVERRSYQSCCSFILISMKHPAGHIVPSVLPGRNHEGLMPVIKDVSTHPAGAVHVVARQEFGPRGDKRDAGVRVVVAVGRFFKFS